MRELHTYHDFSEIESDVAKLAPPILYKYRRWDNNFHKRILTHREIWFSHPFSLNDPQDLRRPYKIDITGYNSQEMFNKLAIVGTNAMSNFNPLQIHAEICQRWQRIQSNPEQYFSENIDSLYNDEHFYSHYGVFSTCQSGLNADMWNSEEYSDSHKGFE